MKKVDGFYWDECPDWQHDKWQFQQLLREVRIFDKMVKDRQWMLDMVEDLRSIVKELGVLNDMYNNANNEIIRLELMRKMAYYQAIAISMYEVLNG